MTKHENCEQYDEVTGDYKAFTGPPPKKKRLNASPQAASAGFAGEVEQAGPTNTAHGAPEAAVDGAMATDSKNTFDNLKKIGLGFSFSRN